MQSNECSNSDINRIRGNQMSNKLNKDSYYDNQEQVYRGTSHHNMFKSINEVREITENSDSEREYNDEDDYYYYNKRRLKDDN